MRSWLFPLGTGLRWKPIAEDLLLGIGGCLDAGARHGIELAVTFKRKDGGPRSGLQTDRNGVAYLPPEAGAIVKDKIGFVSGIADGFTPSATRIYRRRVFEFQ